MEKDKKKATRRQVLGGGAGLVAGLAVGSALGDDGSSIVLGPGGTNDEITAPNVSEGVLHELIVADTVAELTDKYDDPNDLPVAAVTADAGLLLYDENDS